ncbi:MAG TPA: Rv3235 family protein [Streptosporangiaceae bacterium]
MPGGRILVSLVHPLVSDDDPGPITASKDDELAAGAGPAEPSETHDRDDGEDRDGRDLDGEGGDALGQWPSRFAQVLAETLGGARPASQLTPWTTEQARAHIRRLGPLLAVDRPPRVQRVRASQPARDVVEVAVVAEFGSRTRALAARLERAGAQPPGPGRPGRDARWLCTAIESA